MQPDIQSPYIRALALESLAKTDAARKADYAWLLPELTANIQRPEIGTDILRHAVGTYDGRKITLENSTLYYIWRERFRVALKPIAPSLFAIEGVSDFRYRLNMQRGKAALERVNKDGSIQTYKRLDLADE